MDWGKTLVKVGWFLVAVVLGAVADALASPSLMVMFGDNAFAHSMLPVVGSLVVSARDWWKHRDPALSFPN